jgi:hypothetical protein
VLPDGSVALTVNVCVPVPRLGVWTGDWHEENAAPSRLHAKVL